jgi:hypothetical protein
VRPELIPAPGEVYLEYLAIGGQLRVVAIDAATGLEVTVFGPASIDPDELGRIAARKLARRLGRDDTGQVRRQSLTFT